MAVRVRMLADERFEPPGRAPVALKRGDFMFLDDERAALWIQMGIAQPEDDPFPPAPVPTLLDQHGRPMGRSTCG